MSRPGRLLKWAGLAAGALALGVALDATLVEPYRMTVSWVALPAGRLARALGPERLVHLSDLHVKGMGLRERRLLEAVHRIDPGLILMTGDYADTDAGVAALREIFAQIHPRLGVVAVPGNNDYFRGRQARIFAALESRGVRLLRNSSVILRGPGGDFVVAGVDDPFFGRDDIRATMTALPPGRPAILLAHSPAVLMRRSDAMLFNAGDADGPWGKGRFWTDGSHFRDPIPDISFTSTGPHVLRVQRREDGAGLGAVRLVPEDAPGGRPGGPGRGLQGRGKTPPKRASGEIDIDPCDGAHEQLQGSWHRRTEAGGCILADDPDHGVLASYAVPDPADRAEIEFDAPAGVPYRVWVQIFSPTSTGRSDSFYLQWSDAADASGAPVYRIGEVTPSAAGPAFDLVLAGHTHGGQVRLPWIGPFETLLSLGPYVMGRYQVGPTMVYVSRGIGTSYLPIRFDCPPEVVVLSASGAKAS